MARAAGSTRRVTSHCDGHHTGKRLARNGLHPLGQTLRLSLSIAKGSFLLRTLVAETPAELERLRPLWENLYQSSECTTLFQCFEWNFLAAKAFHSREAPRVIAVASESGAAILPACLSDQKLSFLGEALFDYRDMLVTGDAEAAMPVPVEAISGSPRLGASPRTSILEMPFCNCSKMTFGSGFASTTSN